MTKPSNFYFNEENNEYRICYETCGTCDYGGNLEQNNCTSCDYNYIFNPDFPNSANCLKKCIYFYFYRYSQYMCTNEPKCPEDNYMLIKEKRKCIDSCEKDNTYKYQYNGECYIQCPNGTINGNNQFLCKNIAFGKCTLRQKKYESLNADLNEEEVGSLAKGFAKEFNYTSNHVSIFNNIYIQLHYIKTMNVFQS